MTLIPQGFAHIKNVKADIYIGRARDEDKSNGPKSLFPLKSEEVANNAIFQYGRGLNPKLWEFRSLESRVAKTGEVSIYTPEPRPAAFVGGDIKEFYWEYDDEKDKDVIRDPETKKVWTLSGAPDKHVSLEDEVLGDDRQLWKLERVVFNDE